MRKVIYGVSSILILTVSYLLFWPIPIDPLAWTPQKNPGFTGPYHRNNLMSEAKMYPLPFGKGPEDTAIGSDGKIYTGLDDGSVVRFSLGNGSPIETIINTAGRPLGLKFFNNRLYIADAYKGLIYIDDAILEKGHKVQVATDTVNNEKMIFVDDLDIASDGTVWFSDASTRFDLHNNVLNYMEQRPSGRLLSWNPKTNETRVHLEGLGFANGVALGPNETYILVNETMFYRIRRYWIKGEKSGQTDVFIENLPGFPDNLTYNKSGLFWVALIFPRQEKIDSLLPNPFLRKVIMRLPESLRVSEPEPMGWIIAVDLSGVVVHNLQDHTGRIYTVTSVNEFDESLWLGSLTAPNIARLPVPRVHNSTGAIRPLKSP